MTTTKTARKPGNRKPAATKTAEPTPAEPTPATVGSFNPADLPQVGTQQYRQGGDYKPFVTLLSQFSKGSDTNKGHVKALIHLGWVKPGGVNDSSKSPAFVIADSAGLPEACFKVGEPAGPQIAANLQALAEAGAPAEALNGLWAAYVGTI